MLKSNIFLFVVTYLGSPGKTTLLCTYTDLTSDPTEDFSSFSSFFWQRAIFLLSLIPCFYLPDHRHYLSNWNKQKTGFFAFSKYLTCHCPPGWCEWSIWDYLIYQWTDKLIRTQRELMNYVNEIDFFHGLLGSHYFLTANCWCFLLSGGSQTLRASIPFSTKYPELIIPDESVCLPRITCQKPAFKAAGRNSNL